MPVPRTVGFDVETFPIGYPHPTPEATGLPEGAGVVPKVVCGSFFDGADLNVVWGDGDQTLDQHHVFLLLRVLLRDKSVHLVGQRISFDIVTAGHTWPALWADIFKAMEENRIHDTSIAERLIHLAEHGDLDFSPAGGRIDYSLAGIAFKRLGLKVGGKKTAAGEDPAELWRLRFHELVGKRAAEYPREAYDYSLLDAKVAWEIYHDQLARSPQNIRAMLQRVEPFHTNSSICLYLITGHGLAVDWQAKLACEAEVDADLGPENLPLVYSSGLVTPAVPPSPYSNGAKLHNAACPRPPKSKGGCQCPQKVKAAQPESVNVNSHLRPLIEEVCRKHKIPIQLTDGGKEKKAEKRQTSTSMEFLEELAGFNDTLKQFLVRAKLIKLKTSFFPCFEWPRGSGQRAPTIHANYNALMATGRVSSSGFRKGKPAHYPSLNIQQADPRVRGIYVPRPGKVFIGCDYTAIDLVSAAQTLYDLYGYSALRDQFNSGIDPHAFFGTVLAYDGDPTFTLEARGRSDSEALAAFHARRQIRPDCSARFPTPSGALDTGPEWWSEWRTYAKPFDLGFLGGLGPKTMVSVAAGYGFKLTEARAKEIRVLYFRAYPEVKRYLRQHVPSTVYGVKRLKNGEKKEVRRYVTPLGMIRAGCSHTQYANGKALQSPAAEGMKAAMFLVTQACWDPTPTLGRGPAAPSILFGSRVVINMHDELVLEVDADPVHAEACALELERLMVAGMATVIKDVKVSAEPVIMTRWSKKAKQVRDPNRNNMLVAWVAPEDQQ